jgi:hypothetical protein
MRPGTFKNPPPPCFARPWNTSNELTRSSFPSILRRKTMPASLYAGDYARAAWKINDGFSPALCAFLARQNPMTSSLEARA